MVFDEIIAVYEKEEEIKGLIPKLSPYKFEDLIKSSHFLYSVDEKITDFELIKNKYPQFNRIKLIRLRRHKNQKLSYDFYYELDDNTYILFAISFDEQKPYLINAYHINRSFKQFKKSLMRAYRDKLIGN